MSVRPEYGPTLPSLLAARGVSRRAMAVGLVALIALGAGVVLAARALSDQRQVIVDGPPTFNLVYDSSVLREAGRPPGVLLHLTGGRRNVVVDLTARRIEVPAYGDGDIVGGYLPILGERRLAGLRQQYGAIDVYDEGKARINRNPGYQIGFGAQTREGKVFGRDTYVFPDEHGAREGVLLSLRRLVVRRQTAADEAWFKAVKVAFTSLNFGDGRP